MVALRPDGVYVSLLVDLKRNARGDVEVRIGEGARIFDGRGVWEVAMTPGEPPRVRDLVDGRERALPLGKAELLAMDTSAAWFEEAGHVLRCPWLERGCAVATASPEPARVRPGPGAGFRLRLRRQRIILLLPQETDDRMGTLLTGTVESLVGAAWLPGTSDTANPALDRYFRGRAFLRAAEHPVEVDGELDEWDDDAPYVVDAPWQVEDGARWWQGPRDASFGVATARDGDDLCIAGRIRDDRPGPNDTLLIRVAGETTRVSVVDPHSGPLVIEPEWHGFHYEGCLPLTEASRRRVAVGFSLSLVDQDDDEPPTILATSASVAGGPTGTVQIGPLPALPDGLRE
jgi:hypothetical protein